MVKRGAAVGVVENGNTALLVTLGPGRELLDRRQVDLTRGLPTHPHHHQGSWAVGRYLNTPGAKPMALAEAVALVEQVQAAAARGAQEALESLTAAVPVPIRRISLRACPALPASIEDRIIDHRAQTYADSVMYRQALATAAEARGWSVSWYDADQVFRDAAAAQGLKALDPLLRAMGKAAGPPWQAKHKLAAAAALATLKPGARQRGD